MSTISFTIPDESLSALKLPPEEAASELRLLAAIKLYELGRLSSGAAAQIAGIPRTVFLMKLGDYGVRTLPLSEEELREDYPAARRVGPKGERVRLVTFKGQGLQPGVNLDNSAELLDVMERSDADA